MGLKQVDPKVYDLAFDWLSEYIPVHGGKVHLQRPSKARVMSLARDIQDAIEAWADLDEQKNDEMRQLRGLTDDEKDRL